MGFKDFIGHMVVANSMNPHLAFMALNHFRGAVVFRPKLIANWAELVLFPLLKAFRAVLKVSAPSVVLISACLSSATLLALTTPIAHKLHKLIRCYLWARLSLLLIKAIEMEPRIAFIASNAMVSSRTVAAWNGISSYSLVLQHFSQAVLASCAIPTLPAVCSSWDFSVGVVNALLMKVEVASLADQIVVVFDSFLTNVALLSHLFVVLDDSALKVFVL